MRNLPENTSKDDLSKRLKYLNVTPLWIEEIIEIRGYLHTLVGVSSIENAEKISKYFQARKKQNLTIRVIINFLYKENFKDFFFYCLTFFIN